MHYSSPGFFICLFSSYFIFTMTSTQGSKGRTRKENSGVDFTLHWKLWRNFADRNYLLKLVLWSNFLTSEKLIISFFFFFFHAAACEISFPQPGIEPLPPAVEVWRPNHWTTREVPNFLFWRRRRDHLCYAFASYFSWQIKVTYKHTPEISGDKGLLLSIVENILLLFFKISLSF